MGRGLTHDKMNHIGWHLLGRATYCAIFPEIRVDGRVYVPSYSFFSLQALLSIEFNPAIHTGFFVGGL